MLVHRVMKRIAGTAFWLACACPSCDEPDVAPAPVSSEVRQSQMQSEASFASLAVLLPTKPLHLAVDRNGVVYFTQPTDTGRDMVLRLGFGDTPQTTALTSATIATALRDVDLKGNITALCSGADGNLYFFFASTTGKQSRFALGQYNTRTAIVRILVDSPALLASSGLGASMEVATATLTSTPTAVYLTLATIDGSVVLKFDPRRLATPGPIDLTKMFDQVKAGEEIIPITQTDSRISAGPGEDLLLMDGYTGGLWQIDPSGKAKQLSSIVGLPRDFSPAMLLPEERIMFFAADADEIKPRVEARTDAPSYDNRFPAVMILADGKFSAIAMDRFITRPGLPRYAMRLREIAAEPAGTFVVFDAASGELMRMTLK